MDRNIEREWEARRELFARATSAELLQIARAEIVRVPAAMHTKPESMDPLSLFKLTVTVLIVSGSAGAANGRPVNEKEKTFFRTLLQSLFNGIPPERAEAFAEGMTGDFASKFSPQMTNMLRDNPGMASTFADLALCLAFADGALEPADLEPLRALWETVADCVGDNPAVNDPIPVDCARYIRCR